MKQNFKNMEVVISSDRPMFEGSMAAGTGILRLLKKQFIFDARHPRYYKKNPKLFCGTWFKATFSREMFRFTGLFSKNEIIGLHQSKVLRKKLHNELDAAIDKLVTYAA